MTRNEQKEKRRQEILNIGLDFFINKGFAATRTAELAKALGISEGLLFHYFETKESLYIALINIALANRGSTLELSELKPILFFENAAKFIIENCAKSNFDAKLFVLMNQAEHNTSLPEEIRISIAGEKQMIETIEIIKKGQIEGSIKSGDARALATAFWLSVHAIVENMARNPSLPVPKSEWIVDILRNNK